ncbi:hypothetical protein ACFE04_007265 [Oxalis oulophora]
MGNSLQPTRDKDITPTAAQDQELAQQQQIEFTCDICVEPASTTRKFRNNNLCSHAFCVDCIAKYIEVKILDNTAQIACPGLNCKHNLDPVSTMSLISKPLFLKWCDILSEDSVLNINKSYCPNRECMTMVVNECGGSVKKAKCPNCKQSKISGRGVLLVAIVSSVVKVAISSNADARRSFAITVEKRTRSITTVLASIRNDLSME